MDLQHAGYSIELDTNKQLWSVSFVGKVLKWHKTKEEAQDHLIEILAATPASTEVK